MKIAVLYSVWFLPDLQFALAMKFRERERESQFSDGRFEITKIHGFHFLVVSTENLGFFAAVISPVP